MVYGFEYWVLFSILVVNIALFVLAYRRNSTNLLSAVLFYVSLAIAGGLALTLNLAYHNSLFYILTIALAIVPGVVLVLASIFGVYAALIYFALSAKNMLKKERKSFSNMLSLFLAAGLLASVIGSLLMLVYNTPIWLNKLNAAVQICLMVFFVHFLLFITANILFLAKRVRPDKDYIVVLGSGLIAGQVPPLLAARIDKGIDFYKKQLAKEKDCKLIMSGGRGDDEPRSEAEAMAEYARGKGVAPQHILQEGKSRNTFENMLFSKALMESDSRGDAYRAVFATNSYHAFRAGIYARRAGLPMQGLGAKTKWYYAANAVIREYIAYITLHKKLYAILFTLLLLLVFLGLWI